jgi:hypothetical protein
MLNKRKTVRGDARVGDQFTQNGRRYRVTEIISQVEKYELDGVTYSEYPGEEPDLEWLETTFSYEPVPEEELAAQQARRAARREAQEAQRIANLKARDQKEIRFQQFLDGTGEGEVWSGYDLPRELYPCNREGHPINEYPNDYRNGWVGNGLGHWCKNNAALERLFEYAYERDSDCTQKRINAFATEKKSPADGSSYYLAGSEYYRWIVARGKAPKADNI